MIHPPFAHKFHQDNSHPWHTKSDSKNLYIHKLYISHKNQEISIFTTKKKQSKVKTFSTSHREFQVKTKQRIKDQETKNQVNVKAVRTTVPVSTLFRDHQFMYIYKMQIGIDVIKQALLLEEVETTLHHVKIEHIVRCLQALWTGMCQIMVRMHWTSHYAAVPTHFLVFFTGDSVKET
jgi:hypothetical protein